MPTSADFWMKVLGAALGVLLTVYGAGRAWGVLTTELRGTRDEMKEVGRKMSGLHDRFDEFRQETRADMVRLAMVDSRLEGRVEVVERMQGLPPPWKRTQPITPQGDQG